VAEPVGIVVAVAVSGAVWVRFERARDDDRHRILWLVYGLGVTGIVGGHVLFLAESWTGAAVAVADTVLVLCGLVLPLTLAVALVAPRSVDVRRVIAVTVLSVLMVDLVLATFTGTLAVVEALTGRPPPRLLPSLLCVAIAAGFHPVLRRVREALDQVLFGGRPDPVGVVASLGGELRRGGDPQRWLDAVRAAADLPYAELRHDDRTLAASGSVTGPTTAVGLWAGAEHVGDLVVGMPEHHTELPRATAAVLELAAAPLARALQSTRLAEELQESRQRVVVASEEERRRLRRDLHDGLGPVLSGVAYTADAARNVLADRPEQASALLADLRDDVTGAIAEVRRLVHDLRPPALDQLGLLPALRQQADRLHRPDGVAVRVTVDGAVGTVLPAAVEVAAYRLVSEAMLNVARHADTTSARVRVSVVDGALELEVLDGGAGSTPWVPGVGLTSMRERIEQLGGHVTVGATADGGRVHALVPLAASSPG
jgi:signal transduction histidine kinase